MAQEQGTRTRGAKRLTEAGIQRINPPAKGRIEIADAIVPGLRFRITDRDKRSWSLIYRIAGASRLQQRVTIGSWPAVGVAEARKRAKDALFEAMTGSDPAAGKKKQEERTPDLFEDVTAEFVLRFLKPRQKRWQATEAIINNKLVSRWRGRPIRQITKPDVLKLLDREMDAGRQPHVIEAVVNHVSGHKAGVAGIYNRATYAVEKREALERWSIHVATIVDLDADPVQPET